MRLSVSSRRCSCPALFSAPLIPRRKKEPLEGAQREGAARVQPERPGEVSEGRARQSETSPGRSGDRKSTRLNSSHDQISYAVFCLKKKTKTSTITCDNTKSTSTAHAPARSYN